ncbi:MAG TPA: pitrilysin family protein [Candidatus Paceibacterota bacterium]|nr:pitrilysin family protein [Candidatus Paceibacterota bacterium]HRZ34176.1 pitrilysin family protein [Candidatus Paceibacterota bacterium]
MKYKKRILPNGLRIITVPMKESQTAIVTVLVEAGSEYENKKTSGLSHFLEHMCFKGTKSRTGEQICYELDSLGAENNAFTGHERTGYYAKARFEKINQLIDIVSDIYLNPIFPGKDIEIERGVILEEINMYEDIPMRKIHDIYSKLLFGNQPAGFEISGPRENVKTFSRKDFLNYYRKHYIPQKTVVVVSGNINEAKVLEEIKKRFGSLSRRPIIKKPKTIVAQNQPRLKIVDKKIDQTHIIIGFRSFNLYDKRNHALTIAATVLGSGMSSRLFKKMRDELGLCYYVRAASLPSIDYGDFIVTIGAANKRALEAIKVLAEEFKKIRDEIIPRKELNKAKDIILGKLANNLESSEDWADYYGEQEIVHEKILTPSEYAKRIKKVSAADVRKALKSIIRDKGLNLAIIGPQKDTDAFRRALKV